MLSASAPHQLNWPHLRLFMFPPSKVLPEVDASHWAMDFPRVCEDTRQLVGLVFVHLLQIFFIDEVATHFTHHPRIPTLFPDQAYLCEYFLLPLIR